MSVEDTPGATPADDDVTGGDTAGASEAPARARAPEPPARGMAVWIVCAGLLGVVLTTVLLGAVHGAVALVVVLAVAGFARAVIPGPGPIGITVRSRPVDVAMFLGLAFVIAVLARTAPNL